MGVLASTLPIDQKGTPALYSDTLANRPAAGFTGRLFVSTDTFALYRDNGTTWDLIGGPGTGTITGTIQDTQVAFGTAANEIGGNANFIYTAATGQLSIANDNALNPTLLLKQSNANGELIIGRDAGDNDVFTVDQFGTIYAAAIQTFLDFANVYAGEFRNDNANGFGVTVRGGSATNNALVVSDATGAINMLQIFSDRSLFRNNVDINFSDVANDKPALELRASEPGGNLIYGYDELGNRDFIVTDEGDLYCGQLFIGVNKANQFAAVIANTTPGDNGNGVQIQTDGLSSNKAISILGQLSAEVFQVTGGGEIFVRSSAAGTLFDIRNLNASGFGGYIAAGDAGNYSLRIADYANNILYNFLANGNFLIGTNVDNGFKLRVNGAIYSDTNISANIGMFAQRFQSNSGETPSNTGVAVNLFNLSGDSMYTIYAYVSSGNVASYGAYAVVIIEGGDARIVAQNNGTLLTLSLSGTTIQGTQNSGGTVNIRWSYLIQY